MGALVNIIGWQKALGYRRTIVYAPVAVEAMQIDNAPLCSLAQFVLIEASVDMSSTFNLLYIWVVL
jgi:hypothetical protein